MHLSGIASHSIDMDFRISLRARKAALQKLLKALITHEKDVVEALALDFGKPEFESVATETSYVISDLKYTLSNMEKWSRPQWVLPSLINFPSVDRIYREPYGQVLVIAPWNYPFQLALCPLIAAVAAGNSVVLKPSELTPNTSSIIEIIIAKSFDPTHVEVYQGGAEVSAKLLERRWDYIFFTGSVRVGKIVAMAAAKHLTPVTLELGGKSPCIVDQTANLEIAARRIVWGKFVNAGQTCIAPDYILAHEAIRPKLLELLKSEIIRAYGTEPATSPDLARIIDDKNFERLTAMLQDEAVYFGGKADRETRYISPTIIDGPRPDGALMESEIFGPILPVMEYESAEDLDRILKKYPKPLAFYVFSEDDRFAGKLVEKHSYGGGCINDTLVHFANRRLPFGGVGNSGMGAYHGKLGFETFSHRKAVLKRGTWLDVKLRYPPYKNKVSNLKKLMKSLNLCL